MISAGQSYFTFNITERVPCLHYDLKRRFNI